MKTNQPVGGELQQLARLYGVQIAYYSIKRGRRQATREELLAVLRALDAPVASMEDVGAALREKQQAIWRRPVGPVVIAWDGEIADLLVRLPAGLGNFPLAVTLTGENGERYTWDSVVAELHVRETAEINGENYELRHFHLQAKLPYGYFHLVLETKKIHDEALVISAPQKAYSPEKMCQEWGVFLPLYALRSRDSWGAGDFHDLGRLRDWVCGLGGRTVATLPLLPIYIDGSSDFSPYLPVSRQLWNETYVHVESVPELEHCPEVKNLIASPVFQQEVAELQDLRLVDYPGVARKKRQAMEGLCRCLFSSNSDRLQALLHFAHVNPQVEEYACFRAAREKLGHSWHKWPEPARSGKLTDGAYDEDARRYHLYAQWLASEQMESFSARAKSIGMQLYLDLPVGTHSDGYDVWRDRDVYALDAAAGAPPDPAFTRGQNWQFPPLHPCRLREHGYGHFISYLRHHLQNSGILRFDHVMGLHRLFWIPKNEDTRNGVYVRYPYEELYAIISLESHKTKTIIVGEDLGTVPPDVRPAMARHGLYRMFVVQYELEMEGRVTLGGIIPHVTASLGTHDMFPFTSFWKGEDIPARCSLGLLNEEEAERDRRRRQGMREDVAALLYRLDLVKTLTLSAEDAYRACITFLSASRACYSFINMEDLWGEREPQNVPSAMKYPNWRRKARYSFEDFVAIPGVVEMLRHIETVRKNVRIG